MRTLKLLLTFIFLLTDGCAVISSTGEILANTDPNDRENILIYDLAIKKETEN